MIRRPALIVFVLFITLSAFAQKAAEQSEKPPALEPALHELTIDNIFDPRDRVRFGGAPQSGFVWLDDTHFTWPRTDASGKVVQQVVSEVKGANEAPLFDHARLEAAIAKVPGIKPEEAKELARPKTLLMSPDHHSAIITIDNDLYLYSFGGDLTRLTETQGEEKEPTFSPDGRKVAFVRGNNISVIDLAAMRERQLTSDGGPNLLNGLLDWVYQEEIYGRGKFRAYWWSPDSSTIAYLQLDEGPVKTFAIVDHIPTRQELEVTNYPKAGDPNPVARLYSVPVAGGPPRSVDTSGYRDFLIVEVAWRPDSKAVVYQIQDREQTWLDLDTWDLSGNAGRTLLRETSPAWVSPTGNPVWLNDGSFLWLSERTGFKHLYHYSGDGGLLRQVTRGSWEVRTLHGIDPGNRWIYFSGTERSVLGSDVYRVRVDGTGLTRLSDQTGAHSATFNPAFSCYLDSYSNVETPPAVTLQRKDGNRVRVVDSNEPTILRGYRVSKPEFVQVKTRDGFAMEGMLMKPANFDPAKKYPVYEYTYSGPHSQQVRNEWGRSGNTNYLFNQLLAQKGVIVWICDNRTASGKGVQSAWPVYKNFGELELRDLEDGLRWLESNPWVDSTRVVLSGWSFGGFMTSYALTHSKMWSAGISGGTVADWRDYDSVYTERYMLTPEHNPDGYRKSSPRWSAAGLSGNLLLLHGTMDDNVHLQNTIQFAYELEKEGKLFEMALYPKSRHGVTEPLLAKHLRMEMLRFIERNLLAPAK